jgi:hypothetical protein
VQAPADAQSRRVHATGSGFERVLSDGTTVIHTLDAGGFQHDMSAFSARIINERAIIHFLDIPLFFPYFKRFGNRGMYAHGRRIFHKFIALSSDPLIRDF